MNAKTVTALVIGAPLFGLVGMWSFPQEPLYAFVVGVFVGVVIILVGVRSIRNTAHLKAEDEKKKRALYEQMQQQEQQRQQQEEARQVELLRHEIRFWRDNAIAAAKGAVELFELMPDKLEQAAKKYAQAKVALADGAFSPFWAAIEAAYGELSKYLHTADEIGECSRAFTTAIGSLVNRGDTSVRDLGGFPVDIDIEQVEGQHTEILSSLDSIVYEAQKDPTFALIWEQRRTTSAIETGFLNLEDAVNRMGRGISASIASLNNSLSDSNSEIARSLDRLNVTTATDAERNMLASREMLALASEQTSTMKALNSQAEAVRDHLYYPEISRWLR